jgi:hypothetical protein
MGRFRQWLSSPRNPRRKAEPSVEDVQFDEEQALEVAWDALDYDEWAPADEALVEHLSYLVLTQGEATQHREYRVYDEFGERDEPAEEVLRELSELADADWTGEGDDPPM